MAQKFYEVRYKKLKRVNLSAARKRKFDRSCMEVRMFNVGEGEIILLVYPKKQAWIIDCGVKKKTKHNATLGTKLKKYLEDRNLVLKALVASHPHQDHGAAFAQLLAAKPKKAKTVHFYQSDTESWNKKKGWIPVLDAELKKLGSKVKRHKLKNKSKKVRIAKDVWAYFFAGTGKSPYTSIFVQIRYHDAQLLFTGDSHCAYEKQLLKKFGKEFFRSDLLKVTHHGSSSGTKKLVVDAVKHGIAIASTADDDGHRLEQDTLDRLGGHGRPRRVFETLIKGDIVVKTDGTKRGKGILYSIEFKKSGQFAKDMGAEIMSFTTVNRKRTTKKNNKTCQ